MTDGVVLKFSTAEAVAENKRFDEALKRTFETIGSQAKVIQDLEGKIRSLTSAQAAQAQAASSGTGPGSLDAFTKYAAGLRQYDAAIDGVVKKSPALAQSTRAVADGVAKVGSQSSATIPFLQKLLGAAGQQGASKGLGLLATGAKALVTSMNPVGIATGVAASLLLTFGLNALTAQTQTEKLRESARAAQVDFSNLAPAIEALTSGLGRISGAQNRFAAFEGAAKSLAALRVEQQAIIATNTEFAEKIRRTGTAVELNVEQIRQLGEATRQTDQFFRDLETVASGEGGASEQRQALARLSAQIGLRKIDNALIVDATSARKALKEAEEAVGRQIQGAQRSADAEAELAFLDAAQQVTADIQKRTALEKAGNNEREARARLDREAEKLGRELTDIEAKAQDAAIGRAKAIDDQASAEKKLSDERERAAKIAEQSAKADQEAADRLAEARVSFDDQVKEIQKQTALLALDGDQREKRAKLYELEAAAAAAKIPVDEKLQRVMENTVDRYLQAKAASEGREEALRREAQAAQDATARFVRYKDVLEQLRDDGRVLSAPTVAEQRDAAIQREINARIRQADVAPDSTEGIVIANQVRLNAEQEQTKANLEKIKDLGREAFSAIGATITSAIQRGEGFRGTLKAIGESLTQLALQRSIEAAFNAGADALFGPRVARATGGMLPAYGQPTIAAAAGRVIDRFTMMRAGGVNVTVAEGGGSTPEAVLPLRRDSFGRLGVIGADGGGGGNYTFVLPNVRSGEEARRIRPTLRQTVDSMQRSGRRTMRAGR